MRVGLRDLRTTVAAMRQRVTVQTLTKTKDSFGQEVEVWTDAGTYWAEVVMLAGQEALNAMQIKAVVHHKITMRYFGTLSPTQRLKFNGHYLNIESINNVENRNQLYEITCTELAAPVGT